MKPLGGGHGAGSSARFREQAGTRGWDDKWGHGAGTWGGFRGTSMVESTFRVTLGDTGLGHGVGLGDQHSMMTMKKKMTMMMTMTMAIT